MKKILLVCGSGGHSAQALILHKKLKGSFEIEFLIENDDPLTEKKLEGVKVYKTTKVRGKSDDPFTIFGRLFASFYQSSRALSLSKPEIILSTGPGLAIPVFIMGKIMGKKLVFLESWSRVTTKSMGGRVIYRLFPDKFFVQWPEMKKVYPRAIYCGRLG